MFGGDEVMWNRKIGLEISGDEEEEIVRQKYREVSRCSGGSKIYVSVTREGMKVIGISMTARRGD